MTSLVPNSLRLIAWFIAGLVSTILIAWGISHQEPAATNTTNTAVNYNQPALISEFAATHQEPNFYQ